ncbi:S9 family peptidase [Lysobacter sp. LF1]|uniref:S9 family peptidase n=1 Tax=Lysobacter stagni TaxID=3045172 RepID=A0ABT6XCE4_9GAMM|nr:S9 family peptidase [Lysobacter sp. LF1]MDI9237821.1 S9 family peptidase [Lysobacter sp. LF1]
MGAWKGLAGLVLAAVACPAVAQVDLTPFLKRDVYGDIKISPTGEYYAATVPLEDRTILVVIRRSDKAFTARVSGPEDSDIAAFHWVNDERIVVSMAERFSSLEAPVATGELHAINADGTGGRTLMGHYDNDPSTVTLKYGDFFAGFLEDDLPADDENVLISVQAFSADPSTRIDRMNVRNGRRVTVATAPVRRARFTTDNKGEVRFARGSDNDNASKLYYRDVRGSDWRLINDETVSLRIERALGFAADNRTAYLEVEQPKGPDVIVALDTQTGERTELLRDADVSPYSILYDSTGSVPIGATYMKDQLVSRYFDENSPQARTQRMLEKAMPGAAVRVVSGTRDGKQLLLLASSDRNPGDFFLFDTTTRQAARIFGRADWLDPQRMAPMREVRLPARDGLDLHGYLTVPAGSDGKHLPMVVLPHGGPFGVFDTWTFDREVQILAQAGYAVLQVNFRGSGNYGRAFEQSGAREWGGTMQNDLTDATKWAIAQGIAAPERICIYGASYGGYAALMGAAREPDLYRCAVGYVGVYDLPMRRDDLRSSARYLGSFANDWMGDDPDLLARISPNRLPGRVKVPVFLAAGGKDEIAPIKHSRMMEKTLLAGGTPVETLYFPTEGHGFYTEEHQREFYTRLLDFLSRHIGGAKAQ